MKEIQVFFVYFASILPSRTIAARVEQQIILQTTWHRPQTARASVVYSGAYQWSGVDPIALQTDPVIARWCRPES